MSANENSTNDVGYGKPPKQHRFKKGQSGNPKGRPKGARGLKTDLKAELNERVTITENGKRKKLTKQQLMVKQLTAKALKGEIRAITKLSDLTISLLGAEDDQPKAVAKLSEDDEVILKSFLARQAERVDLD